MSGTMASYACQKAEIRKNGYVFGGEQHQYSSNGMPVFSDGTAFRASMRAWGVLMAPIRSDVDGIEYSYMDFYMSVDNPVMPEDTLINVEPKEHYEDAIGLMIKQDSEMIDQSVALGMELMTFDKVMNKIMEYALAQKNKSL